MSSLASLTAASQERKARLAQLKTLKRKQDERAAGIDDEDGNQPGRDEPTFPPTKKPVPFSSTDAPDEDGKPGPKDTSVYLSGRNFDVESRAPRLGFSAPPIANGQETAESRAVKVIEAAASEAIGILPSAAPSHETAITDDIGDDGADKTHTPATTVDLFALRPKKPNWDLKRALEKRMATVQVKTDNAIAGLVRDRIASKAKSSGDTVTNGGSGDGDEGVSAGAMSGVDLVEALHQREREVEEERRRSDTDNEDD